MFVALCHAMHTMVTSKLALLCFFLWGETGGGEGIITREFLNAKTLYTQGLKIFRRDFRKADFIA